MDIEKAKKVFEKYINGKDTMKETLIKAIEVLLNELDKDNNIISDLQNEVTLKQCELDNKDVKIKLLNDQKQYVIDEYGRTIEQKDKIINEMAEWIEKHTGYAIDETLYKESKEYIIDYYEKKAEGK